jgi:hypothetical protein
MDLKPRSRPTAVHGARDLCPSRPLAIPLSSLSRPLPPCRWKEERKGETLGGCGVSTLLRFLTTGGRRYVERPTSQPGGLGELPSASYESTSTLRRLSPNGSGRRHDHAQSHRAACSSSDTGNSPMRTSINSRDAPSRVQRVISSRVPDMRGTSWVGSKSAPRSCPFLVPDYGEPQTLARLEAIGRGRRGIPPLKGQLIRRKRASSSRCRAAGSSRSCALLRD